jgi:glyoxalase superfamily protein
MARGLASSPARAAELVHFRAAASMPPPRALRTSGRWWILAVPAAAGRALPAGKSGWPGSIAGASLAGMPSVIKSASFDAADALALATFWAAVLGSDVDEDSTAEKALVEAAGWGGPNIWFTRVPEPKTAKNRVHFDLRLRARWTTRLPGWNGSSRLLRAGFRATRS